MADGTKNLIPFDQRTEEEQKRIRTAGGIASGAARRRKRNLKQAADLYLSLPVTDRRVRNKIARDGVNPEDIDNQMAMIVGLTEAAATPFRIVLSFFRSVNNCPSARLHTVQYEHP